MENYSIAENVPEKVDKELMEYPELQRQLLFNRDIKTKEKAEKFLNPSYEEDLHDPFLMLGMNKVVERILTAIAQNEPIAVYADYDCDGIPGSVILHDFFKKIEYENFTVYIPDREEEGYGLNKEAINKLSQDGVTLIVTVDLGITNVEEVDYANSLGVQVIITDHHLPGPAGLPPAYAILNPNQKDDTYPNKMLCAAGVAFKLVQALIQKIHDLKLKIKEDQGGFQLSSFNFQLPAEGWEKWLLDMAALATLSDMVPLRGENRSLAYFGLKVLRCTRRLGLRKLYESVNINAHNISEDDMAFMITPRLNAASRMDRPVKAFELLATRDVIKAKELARHLTEINNQRKILVASILKEVKRTIKKRAEKEVIVTGNPAWRIGILGLVASRLVEEYQRPVFVWGRAAGGQDDVIKGSCRSDGSVNLVHLMSQTTDGTLLQFGGHELAGGFSVAATKIHFLEEELIRVYNETQKQKNRETEKKNNNKITIDRKLLLEDVTMNTYALIESLGPFGVGNPKPTFLFENLKIDEVRMFGKSPKHLELSFRKESGAKIRAIKFFANDKSFDVSLEKGKHINLVATFDKSMFRNRLELRLQIVDIY